MLKEVIEEITPFPKVRAEQIQHARQIMKEIESVSKDKVTCELVGSLSRGTELRGSGDVDIFVKYRETFSIDELKKKIITIGRRVLPGFEMHYAQHPYIKKEIPGGREIEIVPCFDVADASKLKSAVDRTPFHAKFVSTHLKELQKKEVLLLKQFCRGIDVYGAEARTNGFSGVLCEMLVLEYNSFENVLKAASKWKKPTFIDLAGHSKEESFRKSDHSLIVVDPVDKNRNMAAAVSDEKFGEFISGARHFLIRPSKEFFFKNPKKKISGQNLSKEVKERGTRIICLKFGVDKKVLPDILWPQLRKSTDTLVRNLDKNEFKVFRSDFWTDEKSNALILLEIEVPCLPHVKKKIGPHVTDELNQEKFLKKYSKQKTGPWVENGFWVTEVKREFVDVSFFLKDFLERAKTKKLQLSSNIVKSISKGFEVVEGNDLLKLNKNRQVSEFFYSYLLKKPLWWHNNYKD